MLHVSTPRCRPAGVFTVMRAGASCWTVAYSRRLIPGAILRTRGAAIDYATALAHAAGFGKTHLRIVEDNGHRRARSSVRRGALLALRRDRIANGC
jgi:hypothetical protein